MQEYEFSQGTKRGHDYPHSLNVWIDRRAALALITSMATQLSADGTQRIDITMVGEMMTQPMQDDPA